MSVTAAYRARTVDIRKVKAKAVREANPGKEKARFAAYSSANSERIKERKQRYRKENLEKLNAYMLAWQRADRDKSAHRNRMRRARKMQAEGTFTPDDVADIRRMQKDKCAACKCKLREKGSVDHITALINGGSNWPRNLQLLCGPCNSGKHARDPIDFMQSRGFLL